MPTSEPLTTGETARSLMRIEQAINANRDETRKDFADLRTKLDNRPTWEDIKRVNEARDIKLEALRESVAEAGKVLREDVESLQASQTWLVRLVIAANIGAVLALVLGGPLPS